jgi:hypothetical protein
MQLPIPLTLCVNIRLRTDVAAIAVPVASPGAVLACPVNPAHKTIE